MPLYIRKSITVVPGVRLNLSKSGLGISAGVRGARISMGPRGTQLNAGRDGVYYRKTLRRRGLPSLPLVRGVGGGWLLWAVVVGLPLLLGLLGHHHL